MDSKALLVIDMQRDLCLDVRRRDKVQEMIAPLRRMIDAFADRGQLVVYPCLALPADDVQFQRFGDHYCIEGTDGAKIIPELLPLKGVVLNKRKHSAFFETELDERLKKAGVSDVYLTGLQTHICIMTTAADSSFRGYRTVAIRECVLSSSDENKATALDWIAKYVGEVQGQDDVFRELGNG